MKTKIYIIPGLGDKTSEKPYQDLIQFSKKTGLDPVEISIDWNQNLMTDFIIEARNQIEKSTTQDSILFGFSFGAFIASILASEFKFKKVLLASLAPYFSEDIEKIPQSVFDSWGDSKQSRIDDFKKYSFPKNIQTDSVFFLGEKEKEEGEFTFIEDTTKRAYSLVLGDKKIIKIPNTHHEIGSLHYIEAIKNEIE